MMPPGSKASEGNSGQRRVGHLVFVGFPKAYCCLPCGNRQGQSHYSSADIDESDSMLEGDQHLCCSQHSNARAANRALLRGPPVCPWLQLLEIRPSGSSCPWHHHTIATYLQVPHIILITISCGLAISRRAMGGVGVSQKSFTWGPAIPPTGSGNQMVD